MQDGKSILVGRGNSRPLSHPVSSWIVCLCLPCFALECGFCYLMLTHITISPHVLDCFIPSFILPITSSPPSPPFSCTPHRETRMLDALLCWSWTTLDPRNNNGLECPFFRVSWDSPSRCRYSSVPSVESGPVGSGPERDDEKKKMKKKRRRKKDEKKNPPKKKRRRKKRQERTEKEDAVHDS